MRVIAQPIKFQGEVLHFSDLFTTIVAQSRRTLATALCGEVIKKGGLDTFSRTYSTLVTSMKTTTRPDGVEMISSEDLYAKIIASAGAVLAFANHLAIAQELDTMRALKDIWEPNMLRNMMKDMSGGWTNADLDQATIMVLSILDNADASQLPGAAHLSVDLGLTLLKRHVARPKADDSFSSIIDYFASLGAYIDFNDHVRRKISEAPLPVGFTLNKDRPTAIMNVTTSLRETSAGLLTRVAAGYLRVAECLIAWLGTPAVLRMTLGIASERTQRVFDHLVEKTKPLLGQYNPGWDLYSGSTFDVNVLGLSDLDAAVPDPLVSSDADLSALPVSPRTLLADVASPVILKLENIDRWLNAAAYALQRASEIDRMLKSGISESGVAASPVAPAMITPIIGSDDEPPIAIRNIMSEIPLLGTRSHTIRLPEPSTFLAGVGLSQWRLYTYTDVVAAVNDPLRGVPLVPAIVTKGSGSTVVPTFANVTLGETVGLITKEVVITHILATTALGLKGLLSQITTPRSVALRQLAEDLRFLGVVTCGTEVIFPYSDHVYHSREFGPTLATHTDDDREPTSLFGTPITLGTTATSLIVTFYPFAYMPSTAAVSDLENNVRLVTDKRHADRSIERVIWLATRTPAPVLTLKVLGWSRVPFHVADVVGVPPVDPGANGVALLCNADGLVVGARKYNAIISLTGADPESVGFGSPALVTDDPTAVQSPNDSIEWS